MFCGSHLIISLLWHCETQVFDNLPRCSRQLGMAEQKQAMFTKVLSHAAHIRIFTRISYYRVNLTSSKLSHFMVQLAVSWAQNTP